jgi:ATP-dependent DNA helicase PIF1
MALQDPNFDTHRLEQNFEDQIPRTVMDQGPRKRQRTSEEYTAIQGSAPKRSAGERQIEVISLIDDDDDPPPVPYTNPGMAPAPNMDIQTPDAQYQEVFQAHDLQNAPFENLSSPSPEPPMETERNMPDLSKFAHPAPAPMKAGNSSDDIVPITEPVLCKEQADLVDLILSGQNVFYTGSAGCGKSTVLKSFVKRFAERGLRVNIIAPTGRAALDINGTTTWSYAGWTPDHHKKPLKDLKAAAHGKFVQQRLTDTHVLVIDEISMVENLHFERLNVIMKEARNSDKAFGGVQLIVTGDFCQLPPVKPFRHCIECGRELFANREQTEYTCRQHGVYYDIDKWAFRSTAWKECNFEHVNLTNIHRQSDEVFIKILQKLRVGHPLLPADIHLLLNHESETRNAIRLFATRAEVQRVNMEMFNRLRSKARTYKCLDHFRWNERHRHLENKGQRGPDGSMNALRDHRFDPQIQLKQGMLVVLLHNLDIAAGLVNGSQGTIQGFEPYDKNKMPKATENARKGRGRELELDTAILGVPVLGGDYAGLRETQIKEYILQAEHKAWPIVTFLNGVKRTIYADCTVNEQGDEAPFSLLSRTQIPLMAAWAMTTHKSQVSDPSQIQVRTH